MVSLLTQLLLDSSEGIGWMRPMLTRLPSNHGSKISRAYLS